MKYIFNFLLILCLASTALAQQKPPYDRTTTNQVMADRATWSRYFMAIPKGPTPGFPAYVPDSLKCGALFYRTTDTALYEYNCVSVKWIKMYSSTMVKKYADSLKNELLNGNHRYTGIDTFNVVTILGIAQLKGPVSTFDNVTFHGTGGRQVQAQGGGVTAIDSVSGKYITMQSGDGSLRFFDGSHTTILKADNATGVVQVQMPNADGNLIVGSQLPGGGIGLAYSKTEVDTKLLTKVDSARLIPNLPVYAANYPSINDAINGLYTARSQAVTLNGSVIYDMTSLAPSGATITSDFASDAIAIDTVAKLTRAASSPTDQGYSGIKITYSSAVNYSAYSVFDFQMRLASVDQKDIVSILKFTDADGTIISMRQKTPTRFPSLYITMNYDRSEIDLASGGTITGFDWTQVAAAELIFQVNQPSWTAYIKNFTASTWANLTYDNIDTYGFSLAGDTVMGNNYIVDPEHGKIRMNPTGSLTSGSSYTFNYYTGGGVVVIPKGITLINRQIFLRSNLNLIANNPKTDIIKWNGSGTGSFDKPIVGASGTSIWPVIVNKSYDNGLYNIKISIGLNGQTNEQGIRIYGLGIYQNQSLFPSTIFGFRNVELINSSIRDCWVGYTVRCQAYSTTYHQNNNLLNSTFFDCYNQNFEMMATSGKALGIWGDNTAIFTTNTAIGSNGGSFHLLYHCYDYEVGNYKFLRTYAGDQVGQGCQNISIHDGATEYVSTAINMGEEPIGNSTTSNVTFRNITYTALRKNVSGSAIMHLASTTNHATSKHDKVMFDGIVFNGGYNIFSETTEAFSHPETNFTIKNCSFNTPARDAISFNDTNASGWIWDNNDFLDTRFVITNKGTGWKVINNKGRFINFSGSFMVFANSASDDEYSNNTATGLSAASSVGMQVTSGSPARINGNVFSGFADGVKLNSSMSGTTISYNVLTGNSTNAINLNSASAAANYIFLNKGYNTASGILYPDGSISAPVTATLNFTSTAAQTSSELTITVTGAADGDMVILGVPNTAVNANTCYTARVSAANTVSVRFNNYSTAAVDPASASFKVVVLK